MDRFSLGKSRKTRVMIAGAGRCGYLHATSPHQSTEKAYKHYHSNDMRGFLEFGLSPQVNPKSDVDKQMLQHNLTFAGPRDPNPETALTAQTAAAQPQGFFVYGTLRPDDPSGKSWTKSFSYRMTAHPARLYDAGLYHRRGYACVVLGSQVQDGKHSIKPTDFVKGWFLSPTIKPNDKPFKAEALLQLKLMQADKIEDYPRLYQRSWVTVELLDPGSGSQQVQVQAFVYHQAICNEGCRIKSGDWLDWLERN